MFPPPYFVTAYAPPTDVLTYIVCAFGVFLQAAWLIGEALEGRTIWCLGVYQPLTRLERLLRLVTVFVTSASVLAPYLLEYGPNQALVRIPVYFWEHDPLGLGWATAIVLWSLAVAPVAAIVAWLFIRRTSN